MERIRRYSRFFQIIFIIIFVLLPIITALLCFFINELHAMYGFKFYFKQLNLSKHEVFIQWPIPFSLRSVVFFGAMIYVGIIMRIFYLLIKLFGLYYHGSIFTFENVRYIRSIGYTLIWRQLLSTPAYFIISKALTQGKESVGIYVDLSEVIIGLIIIFVSWVMEEGRKLKEEQELII